MESPPLTSAPSPFLTTVRCSSVVLSGVMNVALGSAPKSLAILTESETDPDLTFSHVNDAVDGVGVEDAVGAPELHAASAATTTPAARTERVLRNVGHLWITVKSWTSLHHPPLPKLTGGRPTMGA